MNRLRNAHFNEAQQEDRLQDLLNAPFEPELAADWALRKELVQLAPEPLPPELKQRVLRQTRRLPLRWAGGMAVAAGLSGLLLVSQWLQVDEGTITPTDAENFQFAMQTISNASQRAVRITGRELDQHVRMPTMELEVLPYGSILQSMITNSTEPEINKES